jgi:hypothetical protein
MTKLDEVSNLQMNRYALPTHLIEAVERDLNQHNGGDCFIPDLSSIRKVVCSRTPTRIDPTHFLPRFEKEEVVCVRGYLYLLNGQPVEMITEVVLIQEEGIAVGEARSF